MLHPINLREKNLEALKTNNYSIDEIIADANAWFDDLIVPLSQTSRGYKIACKKLADEVLWLREQLKEVEPCQKTSAKLFTPVALSAASSASSSVSSSSSASEVKMAKCKESCSPA